MKEPNKKPEMEPRELRDGSGWYVLVQWGDWPSEQVGGFPTERDAQSWIDHSAPNWLREQWDSPSWGPR